MGRDNFNVQFLNYIENAKDAFVISEEGLLDAWNDMVYIDATDSFILGIHADGSPDMIGAYRYNP